jgi:hypothetical protein
MRRKKQIYRINRKMYFLFFGRLLDILTLINILQSLPRIILNASKLFLFTKIQKEELIIHPWSLTKNEELVVTMDSFFMTSKK